MSKHLSPQEQDGLLAVLKTRFKANMPRHIGLKWADIHDRLLNKPEKLWSLSEMERTGGEPDVVAYDESTGKYIFMIALQRAQRVAGACVMMVLRSIRGRNLNPSTAPWVWLLKWVLKF